MYLPQEKRRQFYKNEIQGTIVTHRVLAIWLSVIPINVQKLAKHIK